MTKKKKRELEEEQRRKAELAKKESQNAAQPAYYGGVNFGEMPGGIPVINGKVNGVQLPPIIQPISFVPTPMQIPFGFTGNAPSQTDDDDFDDDDWF